MNVWIYNIQNNLLLGTLQEIRIDFPWVECNFIPTQEFDQLKELFEKELEYLNRDEMEEWEQAYQKIIALKLHLFDNVGKRAILEFILHIDGNKAWYCS